MRLWSKYQEAVFQDIATGEGHLVVLARAGTGKTTTIVEGLRHVPAGKTTLFVAFNKPIAEELKKRAPRGVAVSTLHSYGLRICTTAYGRLKIDAHRAHDFIRERIGSERGTYELRAAIAKTVSLAKGALVESRAEIDALIDAFGIDVEEQDRGKLLDTAISVLERCKDVSDGRLDFDDMIWLPVVNKLRAWQYDFVFVDETQDLNPCQIQLALRAVKRNGRIVAVGDERQAIYRFRGADENAVKRVIDTLGARTLPLSITYRCARRVVAEVKHLVPDLEAAPGAEEGEVRRNVDKAIMIRDAAPGDFILSRTNAPLIGLCLGFIVDGRKANIQGRDIGAQLAAFIKKSGALDIDALRSYVTRWCDQECKRLLARDPPRDTQAVEDRAACILALSDGMPSIDALLARIEQLFADGDDSERIILSTTHKAKGLERERVWLLWGTYRRKPTVEEDNLAYVAITRARKELVYVTGYDHHARGSLTD